MFAAYVAYNDHEIGRVIQHFEDLGKLDNTLIIYQNGDNGTSAEGGPEGTYSEVAFSTVKPPVDVQMKFYDAWGTEFAYNHMSAGWSWAFDTPFDWFKQMPSRLGGINQNMVVSMAGAHQGQGQSAPAVHARHRSCAHDPGGHRHPAPGICGRHQAETDRGHQLRLHLRQKTPKAPLPAYRPVFRNDGPVGDL